MSSQLSVLKHYDKFKQALRLIYARVASSSVNTFILAFNHRPCVEVELYHNIAYGLCDKGYSTPYCVIMWLEWDVSNAKAEDRAQLLTIECQKRGPPHLTACSVQVMKEIRLSLKEIEHILSESYGSCGL
ncbi:hypothetical protein DFH28DRAFT_1128890 [Melampsora americana]|nr:hypothetical protein DFH28DRAFT_1128890 [Melampsora americana]